MKLLSSEARNRATVAIWRGISHSTHGDMGHQLRHQILALMRAGSKALDAGVRVGPGTNVFTLILRSTSSAAQVRANEWTTAFGGGEALCCGEAYPAGASRDQCGLALDAGSCLPPSTGQVARQRCRMAPSAATGQDVLPCVWKD